MSFFAIKVGFVQQMLILSHNKIGLTGYLLKNGHYSAQGLVSPMERASAARMAAAKPHGWVYAVLGMGDARHCPDKLNNYEKGCLLKTGR
ncbi:MAG: hypothetical protein JXK94_07200 [Deltaproteobacteria bacterium]|nr:hypothetical protein [Deltaproteobacteria bacterium]